MLILSFCMMYHLFALSNWSHSVLLPNKTSFDIFQHMLFRMCIEPLVLALVVFFYDITPKSQLQ